MGYPPVHCAEFLIEMELWDGFKCVKKKLKKLQQWKMLQGSQIAGMVESIVLKYGKRTNTQFIHVGVLNV